MRRMRRLIIWVLAMTVSAGLLLLGGDKLAQATPNRQASIVISDDDFNSGDWTVQLITQGTPGSLTEHRSSGGNPTAYRYTQDTFPAVGLSDFHALTSVHLYQAATYDPATQGAIDHIDYQADNILLSATPAHSLARVYNYFIVVQDGTIYQGGETPVTSATWQASTLTGLQATNFFPLTGAIEGQHPDFSAQGSPLTFGYARYQGRFSGSPPVPDNKILTYEHGIDNWTVTINQASGNSPPVAVDDYFVAETDGGPSVTDRFHLFENDYDPDGDPLVLESFTQPIYGSIENPFGDLIIYTRTGGGPPDSFSYTLSNATAKATATLTTGASAWFIPDCGCVIGCLDPPSFHIEGTASTLDLALIYRLRDQVMKPTTYGNRYVKMYYETTPEIAKILILDQPSLGGEAVTVVELWQDNLYSLVDGNGSATITQAQVDAIKTFLANLSAASSTDLQQLIAVELARLGPLNDYVGLTVKEAKRQAIGDAVIYLPLIVK